MEQIIRWEAEAGSGLEHLILHVDDSGVYADGTVIGNRFGTPYAARYHVKCDPAWRLQEVSATMPDGRRMALTVSEDALWTGADGKVVEALSGCTDIDISATPFTNTLPIRRLGLQQGERREIRAAYLAIPALTIEPVRQAYTCIAAGKTYLYEGLFRDFRAHLDVDEHGLVLDYPSLFRRVPLR